MLRPVPRPVAGIEEEVKLTVEQIQYVLISTDAFDKLRRFYADVLERDDVFQPAFSSTVIFYGINDSHLNTEPDVSQELTAWNTKHHIFVAGDPTYKAAPGPYVFVKAQVWQPWRIYYDFNATFMLDAPEAGIDGRVVVPSRCYYNPSASRPLDGARIGVKDSIDIAGHKTTLNNRAWRELYPPATKHAHCVRLLLDAGAIVVGKLKLQALIVREEPIEVVEFTDPFNPRGDGYQVPSGSSSGSAAVSGSYDWLDFSLGSDTNGSVRKLAHYNGCHTIRPTTGVMNTDGVMPIKILYPHDYLPTPNADQTRVIDQFVSGLETALNVKRTGISIAQRWKEDAPDGQEHNDIAKYLDTAGIYPFFHDVYRQWLLDKIFEAEDKDSLSIMVFPIEIGKPNYRDAPEPPYGLLNGYASLNMSPIMRAPEVTTIGGFFLHEPTFLSQCQENLYTRPDLVGLNTFLGRARRFPESSASPSTTSEEDVTANFAVVHDIASGFGHYFGRSSASLANFPTHDAMPKPMLLFLRGYASPEWLIVLAARHKISPELYRRHLYGMPFILSGRDIYSTPSLPSSSTRVFQLRIPTICHTDAGSLSDEPEDLQQARRTEATIMNKYLMQLERKSKVADSIIRECHLLSKEEHILEQIVSVEVGGSGDSWRAVLWLDSGADLLHSVIGVENPWTRPPETRQWQTHFFPVIVHQGSGNSMSRHESTASTSHSPPPSIHTRNAPGWKASQNVCFLPFHYGSQLDRELACHDALYALSELFKFAASSEVQFLNCLQYRIERELTFIGAVKGSSGRAVSLINLRYIKAILKKHEQSLAGTTCLLKSRDSLDWPRVRSSDKAEQTATILLADFEYLLRRTESLARECEQGMATLANSAVLEESRRSVDMGLRVEKLTRIATIFIPLSFVCSVWGMNFQELGTGTRKDYPAGIA
ncbi:hypothetical protein QQX98_003960 [Neonectria punicea]|uniref:Amidase domain-containing protein n=1 Tax=Neonectria punicea TaxID=979145 RepID=A0ABR1HBD1_9HYPO